MKILQIENQVLDITAEALSIKEFKDLWLRDKDKHKKHAIQELSYIYFMTDYQSAYNGYDEEEKEHEIIKDVFGDESWRPDEMVSAAMLKYERLQATPSMRFLKAARKAAQSLINYFETVDLAEIDKFGKPIHKVNDVVRALGGSAQVVDAIDKWEKKVQKEQFDEDRITGGGQAGIMEDPD